VRHKKVTYLIGHRRHPKAFASADVMFYFLGFRASMLTVNESKIKSRRCAHLYQRRCRRFDDKPVHGFATEKPLAQ